MYGYEKVNENDLEEQAGIDGHHMERRQPRFGGLYNSFSHVVAAIAGAMMYFAVLKLGESDFSQRCTDIKLRRSSVVPEELTRYSETVRFNGTLDFPSKFRGSWEEVTDEWLDITNVGFLDLDVTEDDIIEIGVDSRTLARFPESDGGNYVMSIEYSHQLHCLDMLRRITPWNYPNYIESQKSSHETGGPKHTEELFRTHMDHCTEMLRQILMCHADTTPIFEQWVTVRGHPWPNFNTVHQCRNFDAIHTWTKAHVKGVDVQWPTRPEGAQALASPP